MSDIPNLSELKRSNIQVSRGTDGITLYYVSTKADGKTKKTPLHVKTNCWTCPYGRDDQGKLLVAISDDQYFNIEELDRYGRDVCKYFLKQDKKDGCVPEEEELPYKPLLNKVDGLDVLQLQLSDNTRVFDSNGVKLTTDQANQWMSGQFSGHFLLSLGLRKWSVDSSGTYYWVVQPVQIKIKRYFTLPEGCKIFDNEQDLQNELDNRAQSTAQPDDEAVVDFDPDVNELLD